MRVTTIFSVMLMVACDPSVGAIFELSPPSPPRSGDADVEEAIALVSAIAQRYRMMEVEPPRFYGRDALASFRSESSDLRTTSLVLLQGPSGLEFRVGEFLTDDWTPRGDSLRQTMRDTLIVHYGPRISQPRGASN